MKLSQSFFSLPGLTAASAAASPVTGGGAAILSAAASAGNSALPANPLQSEFVSLLQSAAVIPTPATGIEIKNTVAGGAANFITSLPLSAMTGSSVAALNPALPQQQNFPGASKPASSGTTAISLAVSQVIAAQPVIGPDTPNADTDKPLAGNEVADSPLLPVNPMEIINSEPAAVPVLVLPSDTQASILQTAPGVAPEDIQEAHNVPALASASGQRENVTAPPPQNTQPSGTDAAQSAKPAIEPRVNPPVGAPSISDLASPSKDTSSIASDQPPAPGNVTASIPPPQNTQPSGAGATQSAKPAIEPRVNPPVGAPSISDLASPSKDTSSIASDQPPAPGNVTASILSADAPTPAVATQVPVENLPAQAQAALHRPIKPIEKGQTVPSGLLGDGQKLPAPPSNDAALFTDADKDTGTSEAQSPLASKIVPGPQTLFSETPPTAVTAAGVPQTPVAAPIAEITASAPEIASASGRNLRPTAAPQKPAQALKDAPTPSAAATSPAPGQTATLAPTPSADGQILTQNFSQMTETVPVASPQDIQISQTEIGRAEGFATGPLEKTDALRSGISPTPARAETHPASPPIRDIAINITQHADTGANRFQLRLDPPELGRVDVRMEISPEGKLSAVIAVERPETLDLLQRDQRVLERSLTEAGLKTDGNSLNFSLKGGRQDHQSTDLSRNGSDSGADGPLSDDWDDAIAPTAMRFSNRAVNIHI